MIQLLFALLAAEAAVAVALLFKTPLRKLVLLGLDRLKRGRGLVMVKTVASTVLVVLASSVYSMEKIRGRSAEVGALNPTDQVLFSRHLLEASLMGFSLFLALIIDRLHHFIREIRGLRKNIEAAMKRNRELEEVSSSGTSEEIKTRQKVISDLEARSAAVELESEARAKETKASEANALALQRHSEGFRHEYDRILLENQNLRRLHHGETKKDN